MYIYIYTASTGRRNYLPLGNEAFRNLLPRVYIPPHILFITRLTRTVNYTRCYTRRAQKRLSPVYHRIFYCGFIVIFSRGWQVLLMIVFFFCLIAFVGALSSLCIYSYTNVLYSQIYKNTDFYNKYTSCNFTRSSRTRG